MFCSKCGKQLPNDARFCESCGAPVPQKTNTHREPPATTDKVDPQDFGNVSREPYIKRGFIGAAVMVLVLVLFLVVVSTLPSRSDPTEVSNPVVALAIGDSYLGGKIAYLDGTGQHGLIAAPSDQGEAGWSSAIQLCDDLTLNGYSDWYLPNKDELNQLYLSQTAVGGFTSNYYWSSSESNSNFAWYQLFYGGIQNINDKHTTYGVRAVRTF